jgi:hypothetical protein
LLSESRVSAYRFEFLRLFAILPLGLAGLLQIGLIDSQYLGPVLAAGILYSLVSATALRTAKN